MKQAESKLQEACINWFRYQYPKYLIFAVPNGGTRSGREAQRLKREGVLSGVSDLILLKPNAKYPFLCIEMKVGRNKQTENQIEFQKSVESIGAKYIICRSIEQFINEINNYLNEH